MYCQSSNTKFDQASSHGLLGQNRDGTYRQKPEISEVSDPAAAAAIPFGLSIKDPVKDRKRYDDQIPPLAGLPVGFFGNSPRLTGKFGGKTNGLIPV